MKRQGRGPEQLAVSWRAGTEKFARTTSSHVYSLPGGGVIIVPREYAFDLASVPRTLWPLCGPHELGFAAAAVHDYLYEMGGEVPELDRQVPRREADRALLDVALDTGVPLWRAIPAYLSVAALGWIYWSDNEEAT